MAIDKSDVQPGQPRTNLLARYPLTFYFIIALGGTWIVWSLFVLSQDGAGSLPFRSPTRISVVSVRLDCDSGNHDARHDRPSRNFVVV